MAPLVASHGSAFTPFLARGRDFAAGVSQPSVYVPHPSRLWDKQQLLMLLEVRAFAQSTEDHVIIQLLQDDENHSSWIYGSFNDIK